MLLRSPLALFGVYRGDRATGWVAGVVTDCLSVAVDEKESGTVFQDVHAGLGRDRPGIKSVIFFNRC